MKSYYEIPIEVKYAAATLIDDYDEEVLRAEVEFVRNERNKKVGVVLDLWYFKDGFEYAETRCDMKKSEDMDGFDFDFDIATDHGTFRLWITVCPGYYCITVG